MPIFDKAAHQRRIEWFNRDRFVMSAGHGSALLYSTLHMFGFPISNEELRDFRKLGGRLHGHPEVDQTMGVEASTGPLGQGIANAVGIALAEKRLAFKYNRDDNNIVDNYTYCFVGDGCLMEGVSYEAANLAGLWKLNKLIVLYDSNDITLDGAREQADGENVRMRFESVGWNVIRVEDGNDVASIDTAIKQAKQSNEKPTLIEVKTKIGFGSSVVATAKAHGLVMTVDEISKLRIELGVNAKPFEIEPEVKDFMAKLIAEKESVKAKWSKTKDDYAKKHPELYNELKLFNLPIGNEHNKLPKANHGLSFNITAEGKAMTLRDAGHAALGQIHKQNPRLWGANADISSTTKAFIAGGTIFSHDNMGGDDIAIGVREHAMGAIVNGLALSGFMPYCSTFLAFSDYVKPSIRLSALMNLPVHYIFSHDGVGHAQDGPTHQATEHIDALRIIPNLMVSRPADDIETAVIYKYVYENAVPAATILSRGGEAINKLNPNVKFASIKEQQQGTIKGAYVLSATENPVVNIIATGTEVATAAQVQTMLLDQGIGTRLISAPSMTLLDKQSDEYMSKLLGDLKTIVIEMGAGATWYRHIRGNGIVIGFNKFGYSGNEHDVREKIGFTTKQITQVIKEYLK